MPTDKELLIKDLMHKCDCLYRENSRLKEMVSTQPLEAADKEAYEALLSDKDAIIAQKEAKINSLEQRVSYLERQLYGKKAEKKRSSPVKKRGGNILRENPFRKILRVRRFIYIPKGIIRRSGRSFPERK